MHLTKHEKACGRIIGVSTRTLSRWLKNGMTADELTHHARGEYVSPSGLARQLGVSRGTVYRWLWDGVLEGIKIHKTIRIRVDSVRQLLAKNLVRDGIKISEEGIWKSP